jgi:hypothetical protein
MQAGHNGTVLSLLAAHCGKILESIPREKT